MFQGQSLKAFFRYRVQENETDRTHPATSSAQISNTSQAAAHSDSSQWVLGGLTLHPRGAEALASEEDCVVVVFGVIRVAFLLHKGPAAHVLQAPGRVASLNEADGLTRQKGGGGGGGIMTTLVFHHTDIDILITPR